MYLIFDTETTGLAQFQVPFDHPAQPRIIQLACLLLDESFNEKEVFSTLIKPAGWVIEPGAQAAHGISIERCNKEGIPIEDALTVFDGYAEQADRVVAHNLKFDAHLIDVEQTLRRTNTIRYDWPRQGVCTMLASTEVLKLPARKGSRGKYKWPKCSEAYEFMYHKPAVDLHDALGDCRTCAKVFQWLVEHNFVSVKKELMVA